MTTITETPALSLSDTAYFAFSDIILTATMAQTEAAAVWYHDAQTVAQTVADNMGIDLERGASIVAAFSPRERWATNVAKAVSYSNGVRPNGLQNNLRMADASLAAGFDALKGLKTNAFARAIAGDTNAVVIDVWMMRAAGMTNDSPTKAQYIALSNAVRKVASDHGITPRTAQALIWIIVRGSAN